MRALATVALSFAAGAAVVAVAWLAVGRTANDEPPGPTAVELQARHAAGRKCADAIGARIARRHKGDGQRQWPQREIDEFNGAYDRCLGR